MPGGHYSDSHHDPDELDGNERNEEPMIELEQNEASDGVIPGAVEVYNCRIFSTRDLYQKMNKDKIDVEPPYHRDRVWPKASQSALIDSIFTNKWVPALLFSHRLAAINNKGFKTKSKWVCMDGKQRLTSIKLFLDGEIPWYRPDKRPWFFKQSKPPNPTRLIISENLQQIFLGRGMVVALHSNLTKLQERDISRLIQEGRPLTIGENMQTIAGPWGEYLDELTQKYMVRNDDNPNGWSGRIAHMKRGAEFKTMVHMVLLIREKGSGNQPPRHMTPAIFQEEMKALENAPVPEKLKQDMTQFLQCFMDISTLAPPKTLYTIELNTPQAIFAPIVQGRKTMLSPIEMIWILYMISCHASTLSKDQLLELIEIFKVDIRQRYPGEIKNPPEVIRFISDWITKVDLKRIKGKYAGYAVPRLPPTEDGISPDLSGMPEMAQNLNMSNTHKRSSIPDQSQCVDPATPALQTFKKPRLSAVLPTPAPLGSINLITSQPQTSQPQRAPVPNQTMTEQNKSSYPSDSQTGPLAHWISMVPAGSGYTREALEKLGAERAQAVANGSRLAKDWPSAGPQLAASRPPNGMIAGGVSQTSQLLPQSAPICFAADYPPPTV